jgi:hypothetical protein
MLFFKKEFILPAAMCFVAVVVIIKTMKKEQKKTEQSRKDLILIR